MEQPGCSGETPCMSWRQGDIACLVRLARTPEEMELRNDETQQTVYKKCNSIFCARLCCKRHHMFFH